MIRRRDETVVQIHFCNLGFTNVITNIDSIRDEFLRMTCQDFVTKYHGYSELVILYLNLSRFDLPPCLEGNAQEEKIKVLLGNKYKISTNT